jgi:hypothetical protein
MPLHAQPMATFPVRNAATIKLFPLPWRWSVLDLSESPVRVRFAGCQVARIAPNEPP